MVKTRADRLIEKAEESWNEIRTDGRTIRAYTELSEAIQWYGPRDFRTSDRCAQLAKALGHLSRAKGRR